MKFLFMLLFLYFWYKLISLGRFYSANRFIFLLFFFNCWDKIFNSSLCFLVFFFCIFVNFKRHSLIFRQIVSIIVFFKIHNIIILKNNRISILFNLLNIIIFKYINKRSNLGFSFSSLQRIIIKKSFSSLPRLCSKYSILDKKFSSLLGSNFHVFFFIFLWWIWILLLQKKIIFIWLRICKFILFSLSWI